MFNKRKGKQSLFSLPVLYLLFGVYLLGTVFGSGVLHKYSADISLSVYRQSFINDLGRCVLYYAAILLFSRMPLGSFAIPLIVWGRAFVYSIAVSAFIECGVWNWETYIGLCVPAVIHLTGLFYLASLGVMMSLRRLKKSTILRENIFEVRRGALAASICAVLSAAAEVILHTS